MDLSALQSKINKLSKYTESSRQDQEASAFQMQQNNAKLRKSAIDRNAVADALRVAVETKMNKTFEKMRLVDEIKKLKN